jgi:hypothetical protein
MGLRGQVTTGPEELAGLREAYTPPANLIAEAATLEERYYRAERIEHVGAIPYEFTYLLEKPERGLVDAATATPSSMRSGEAPAGKCSIFWETDVHEGVRAVVDRMRSCYRSEVGTRVYTSTGRFR